MPAQVAVWAAAAVQSWGWGATAANIVYGAAYVATTAALAYGASALAQDAAKNDNAGSVLDIQVASDSPRQIVVGDRLTAGSLVGRYIAPPGTDKLIEVIALADHRCEACVEYVVDGIIQAVDLVHGVRTPIPAYRSEPDRLWVTWYDGRHDQTADPTLAGYTLSNQPDWTTDHRGRGVSYAIVEMQYDDDVMMSPVSSQFRLHGGRWYDRRKDDTAGGVGDQRHTDPNTWTYTKNPDVFGDHYQLGIVPYPDAPMYSWGIGLKPWQLPYDLFKEEADISDEDVEVVEGLVYEKRYEMHCVLSAAWTHKEILTKVARAKAGRVVDRGGRLVILGPQARTPVMTIYDDDLVVGEQSRYSDKLSISELYNTFRGTFPDPSQRFRPVEYPQVQDADWLEQDGGEELPEDIDVEVDIEPRRVQRLVWLHAKDRRRQARLTECYMPWCSELEEGDWFERVGTRFPDGKLFEVTRVEYVVSRERGLYVCIYSKECDPSDVAWTADMGSDLSAPPVPEQEAEFLAFSAPAISADDTTITSGGATLPAISVAWSGATDSRIRSLRIDVRESDNTPVTQVLIETGPNGGGSTGTTVIDQAILPDKTYKVRARYESTTNKPGPWCADQTVSTGDDYVVPRAGTADAPTPGSGWEVDAAAAVAAAAAAATSASAAATHATNAATAATNAATAKTQAEAAQTAAEAAEADAITAATNAANSATAASGAATAAAGSATSASGSATSASGSASAAASSASAAAASASSAAGSASAASTSASGAATSAGAASTSASAAQASSVTATTAAGQTWPSVFEAPYWTADEGTRDNPIALSSGFYVVSGEKVYRTTADTTGVAAAIGSFVPVPGRYYKGTWKVRRITASSDGRPSVHYPMFYFVDSGGTPHNDVTSYTGGASFPFVESDFPLSTWKTFESTWMCPTSGTPVAWARPRWHWNYDDGSANYSNAVYEFGAFTFADVTDSLSAAGSATAAASSASSAAASQSAAASSASAANTSATNAATSASQASTSASQASTSETNAAGSASTASSAATAAASSQSAAAGSASAAAGSASTASTQASNAASSAGAAASSASAANTSATNAATSESNASTYAGQASTSAGNAASSASTAGTHASNAAGSASTATSQASAASASATAAASSATLAATYVRDAGANLVPDSTFARGGQGWSLASGASVNTSSSWGAQLIHAGTGTRVSQCAVPQIFANTQYTLSADFVAFVSGGSVYCDVIWLDSGGGTILDDGGAFATTGQDFNNRKSATLTSPSGAASAVIRFVTDSISGYTYAAVRQIKFEQGGSPTMWRDDQTTIQISADIATGASAVASNTAAIAALSSSVSASFATTNANVSSNAAAIASEAAARTSQYNTLTASVGFNKNLVPDAAFKRGGLGWALPAWNALTADNGDGPFIYSSANGTNVALSPAFPCIGTAGYAFQMESALYASSASGNFSADVEFYNSGGSPIGTSARLFNIGTTTGWARYTMTFTAPSGAVTGRVRIFSEGLTITGGNIYARRVKVELGSVATTFTDDQTSQNAFAEVSTLQSATAAPDGSTAIIAFETNASGVVTGMKIISTNGYSGSISQIILSAADIILAANAINFGSNTVFEDTYDTFHTTTGGKRNRFGGPFGASGDLMEWFGPTTVALNSETKTNGYWAKGTDGVMYFGGGALSAGTPFAASKSGDAYGGRLGAGAVTSNNVTVSASNGSGSYTYRWWLPVLPAIGTITIDSPSSASTSFSATIGSAEIRVALARCDVTDSTGRVTSCDVQVELRDET